MTRPAPRGCNFVHDYNHKTFQGAKAAVRQFSEEAGVPFLPISDTAGSVVFQKLWGGMLDAGCWMLDAGC